MMVSRMAAPVLLLALVVLPGCKKAPPPIVAVSGIVTLNGKPLDKAEIRFYPQTSDLTSEFIGSAVTDDEGRFTLMTNGQSGAAQCDHLVTADNEPLPSQYRGMSQKAQEGYSEYLRTLKNRPIPDKYKFLPDTPLKITVTGPTTDLKIELTK
ncbi:hypothetical protein BH11PLA2_BH11PLA2_40010 [soil metagenome]